MNRQLTLSVCLAGLLAGPAVAQHSQVSSVAVNPNNPNEIWVCNRGNDSVSVIDTTTNTLVDEIDVGVWPRSLAFTPDGLNVLVANQRGNVPVDVHFVTPFTGNEVRGTVSVIDVVSRTVYQVLMDVGVEPYGLAFAPNDEYFAVTGFRSGTVHLFAASPPFGSLGTFEYPWSMNFITSGTIADVDSNTDMFPDLSEPRAFVIEDTSETIYVTHLTGGFVSRLDVTLDISGVPTGVALGKRIDLNTYAPHPIFNAVNVQDVLSQGTPRFLDDIALSPDGSRAMVPHVIHNINHDVNHTFVPAIDGDFANRVYPAVSIVDTVADSYGQGGDTSFRLHHELTDELNPAEYVPFGGKGSANNGVGILTLGGEVGAAPIPGQVATVVVTGSTPGAVLLCAVGTEQSVPLGAVGTLLVNPIAVNVMVGTTHSATVPGSAAPGSVAVLQVAELDTFGGLVALSNGVRAVIGTSDYGVDKMGYRAGQPGRVLYNEAGDRALLLNRGSEDVFLYEVNGSSMELMTVFPPRHDFVERAALDTSTPMGDLPLGMAFVEDSSTNNDDGTLFVINETTRTVSSLFVDFEAGVIQQCADQVSTLEDGDLMTVSERIGQELFEDASRAQTAGNFNNSCSSCHFEGNADANVWQRPAGPRSTMQVYGGSLLTGLILWKGVRLHLGETGPMFGGENGGHGVLSDTEQQGLIDYHRIIPVPLNPHLLPDGSYTATAALGEDLFFGTNNTGLNPFLRHAGCATCHPAEDDVTGDTRGYTEDFLDPLYTDDIDGLEAIDPDCIILQENIVAVNVRDVNTGVNVDLDEDTFPDPDRNLDGYSDIETYIPLNPDDDDDFTRDDDNSYICPDPPPAGPKKLFKRGPGGFSIPTKLGVFSTGPYFHDHSASSLRALVDPEIQQTDPVYGNAAYPGLLKLFNEFHDVRGHEQFVLGASKVQTTLQTVAAGSTFDADIEAILEYIASL